MRTVMDILKKKKQKETWSVLPKSTVFDALKMLKDKEIGALMVIDEKGKVAGIFSERDYARKVILKGKYSHDTLIEEIMTPANKMFSVSPDTPLYDCMAIITEKHVRHLPVFDKKKYLGLISIGDIMKSIVTEKDDIINHLSDYIAGKY
jgi:CBS domain-containing protein